MEISELVREFPRWEKKVRVTPHKGCWEWLGTLDRDGYATGSSVKAPGTARAHRVVYRVLVGEIPREVTLDHECEVRHCVNPEHLTPCTAVENVKNGATRRVLRLWEGPLATVVQLRRAKGICPNGHILAEVGTLPKIVGGEKLYIRCKACQHETQRQHRVKNGLSVQGSRGAYGPRKPGKKSQYKGVSWNKAKSRWFVAVYFQGKNHYSGMHEDEHHAGEVAAKLRESLEAGRNLSESKVA